MSRESASFHVSVLTLSRTSITAGETAEVSLKVENHGERLGTFETNLTVNGKVVETSWVRLEAGGTDAIVFQHRFDEPGTYEIAVAGKSVGTITVEPPSEEDVESIRTDRDGGGESTVEVVAATVPADWVRHGYETTVRATVVNEGNSSGVRKLTVTVDGHPVASETVALGPDERRVVAIEFEPTSGTVAVEGVSAGRIEVSDRRESVRSPEEGSSNESGLGLEIGFAFVVLVVGTLAGAAVHDAQRPP